MGRKRLTDEARAEIALSALQSKETVAEICNRFGITDATFYRIKDQALAALPEAMKTYKNGRSVHETRLEKENKHLKELVADYAVAVDILKKNRTHLL